MTAEENIRRSLKDICGHKIDVYAMWVAAAGFFVSGIYLPVITFTELFVKKSTYSVLSGVADLTKQDEWVLAAVIFIFSVIFPILKLIALAHTWFGNYHTEGRNRFLHILGHLGKWSMLDVYVVAMTVVIAKGSILVKAEVREGMYLFAASVILSMLLGLRLSRLAKGVKE